MKVARIALDALVEVTLIGRLPIGPLIAGEETPRGWEKAGLDWKVVGRWIAVGGPGRLLGQDIYD
jgi:hypothetical protein